MFPFKHSFRGSWEWKKNTWKVWLDKTFGKIENKTTNVKPLNHSQKDRPFSSFYMRIKHKYCKSQFSYRHFIEHIFVKYFQDKMANVGKRSKNQGAENTQTISFRFTKRSGFPQRQGLREETWGRAAWPSACAVRAVVFWVLNVSKSLGCRSTRLLEMLKPLRDGDRVEGNRKPLETVLEGDIGRSEHSYVLFVP